MVSCPAEFISVLGRCIRGDLVNRGGVLGFETPQGINYDVPALRLGRIVIVCRDEEPSKIVEAMRDLCEVKGIRATIDRRAT
jgi:hypothetical protein